MFLATHSHLVYEKVWKSACVVYSFLQPIKWGVVKFSSDSAKTTGSKFVYDMRNVLNSINMQGFIFSQPKKLSSSNRQAWQRGRKKYKNKRDKKEEGKLTFAKSVYI